MEALAREKLRKIFSGHRSSFTLRMAPLIDMIFLLLIFFLVAAKWRPDEKFLPFRLPSAQAQGIRVKPEPLFIHLMAAQDGCEVRLGRFCTVAVKGATAEQDLAALAEQLSKCLEAQKRVAEDPVEIICEPGVKWDYFAKIYNLFYGAGLTDITLVMPE